MARRRKRKKGTTSDGLQIIVGPACTVGGVRKALRAVLDFIEKYGGLPSSIRFPPDRRGPSMN